MFRSIETLISNYSIAYVFPLQCLRYQVHVYTAFQNQKAVSAYFTSNQILPFGFADQYTPH